MEEGSRVHVWLVEEGSSKADVSTVSRGRWVLYLVKRGRWIPSIFTVVFRSEAEQRITGLGDGGVHVLGFG